MPKFTERLKNGWNAFVNNKDPSVYYEKLGSSSSIRPDRSYIFRGNDRTIITSVYNRIANDVAACDIEHVKTDENGQYVDTINSYLNEALTVSANIDQTGRELIREAVLTMFDTGWACFVPVEVERNPYSTGDYDIYALRLGRVLEWFPKHVRVSVYNEEVGRREELILPKALVALVENPFYSVVNAPNSIYRRLSYKLNLLDVVDEQSSSGKLDMIIQLPYVIRTDTQRKQAEIRRKEIEKQLSGSKYGIAYTDGTERITQLNRAVENNLLSQVEFLTNMFYGQLGITAEIINGTADEKTMLNYTSRTIEPFATAITEEMTRKFLTPTARTQKQKIKFFKDPFKLVPIYDLAESVQIFTSNEILSSNEVRGIIGYKPVDTERANSLINKNINTLEGEEDAELPIESEEDIQAQLDLLDENDKELDEFEQSLVHGDMPEDYLAHYASKYYDPVKAHEYYEQHKKLKGRNSSSGLNEKGKEVWYGVKTNLAAEKSSKKEAAASARDEQISANADFVSNRISRLRDEYANLPAAEKRARSRIYQKEIERLRRANANARDILKQRYKDVVGSLDSEYEDKEATEYDRILSDPQYQKKAAAKKGRSSSSKNTGKMPDSWTRASDRKTVMYRKDIKK